ncbi:FAD/NAD(P)-binding domain-containing protein [Phanerochaete sordida]|uniref:FAD/NAD(P)-binding domain-containing protein n=1 Tax=Phanerochaete sordida TaxID=48140 RepID=A0A9P3GHN5_9APHY|nr:FAD/NAD(P)-binding domain-containing protein [Phanerochaete sordida]
MQASGSKFRVAICGGGIGGLCFAAALSRYPEIKIDVYEAAQSFKEVGAGIMVWGRTWQVLTLLGLERALRDIAGLESGSSEDPDFGFDFRRSDTGGEEGHRIHLLRLPCPGHLFHRAHFLQAFVDVLPEGSAHLGKRLESYHQANFLSPIELNFTDGSSAACDVLVGADGIRSVVRRWMFNDLAKTHGRDMLNFIQPFFSGTVIYRSLVPAESLRDRDGQMHRARREATMYCGLNKHIVCYPVARGTLVNFVGMATIPEAEGSPYTKPWVSESSREEVLACFQNWEPEAEELVKLVQKPLKWAVHQLHPLPTYIDRRVALLGDAAHAMTPHQGAGAGQAIEDAFILAGLLGDPSVTKNNLTDALEAYNHVRVPFANKIIGTSRHAGAMYELRSAHGDDYSTLAPAIQNQWDWVDGEDVLAQLERALKWMKERGVAAVKASL